LTFLDINIMHKNLFLLFLIITSFSFSQNSKLTSSSKVSILTCGTGNESYSLYGHTGIRIKDISSGIDIVYNYGAFDFQTPNFMLKFVKGDLQYFVTTNQYADFEYGYRYENRSIYEQELGLTLEQKQLLYQQLNGSLFSEDRYYTYKFIDRNCTTMVIDKINSILGSKIITTKKPVTISYREILFPYVENHYFQKLGINIIFGNKVDNAAETLFLPLELHRTLKESKVDLKPLVTKETTVYEAKIVPYQSSVLNSAYIVISILVLIVLANNKHITSTYLTIAGLMGVFLTLVGLYSFHEEVLWNYNVFLFNPLLLLFVFTLYKRNTQWIINVGKINLVCLVAYLLFLLNKVDLMLLLPFIAAHFIMITRIIMKCKSKNKVENTIVL
jgi:hypothetical protein